MLRRLLNKGKFLHLTAKDLTLSMTIGVAVVVLGSLTLQYQVNQGEHNKTLESAQQELSQAIAYFSLVYDSSIVSRIGHSSLLVQLTDYIVISRGDTTLFESGSELACRTNMQRRPIRYNNQEAGYLNFCPSTPSSVFNGFFLISNAGLLMTSMLLLLYGMRRSYSEMMKLQEFILEMRIGSLDDGVYLPPFPQSRIGPVYDSLKSFARTTEAFLQKAKEGEKQVAIARTTQALAHDVRKPFAAMKSTLSLLQTSKPSDVHQVLDVAIPDVEQAIHSVNGMIEDVMQVGSEVTLHPESASFQSLIRSSLVEISRIYPQSRVSFKYTISSNSGVEVDTRKVLRVLSNIIGNAFQAMSYKGEMLFTYSEASDSFNQISIMNTGTYIPTESVEKLFDAFFTSGKKDGTGLGLSIAKKIVEAHGGKIACRSEKTDESPDGFVEFTLTLPRSKEPVEVTETLEQSSQEIVERLKARYKTPDSKASIGPDENELNLARNVLAQIRRNESTLKVHIFEDEAIYRNHLTSLLKELPDLQKHVEIETSTSATAEALQSFQDLKLVIMDVDLGKGNMNGLEASKTIRENGYTGQLCIHSNRYPGDNSKEAFEAGADAVFPKPMSRAHFLKLLLSASEQGFETSESNKPKQKIRIAHVDDSLIFRMSWKVQLQAMEGVEIESFDSPESFLEALKNKSFDIVFTDYYFDPVSETTGLELAQELKEQGFEAPLILSSSIEEKPDHFDELFAGLISKDAPTWSELQELLKNTKVPALT